MWRQGLTLKWLNPPRKENKLLDCLCFYHKRPGQGTLTFSDFPIETWIFDNTNSKREENADWNSRQAQAYTHSHIL